MEYKIVHFKEIDSTNNQARRDMEPASDRTVWLADFQTSGRGQKGNGWESRPGENLTFSMLLKPKAFLPERQFSLSQAVALSVMECLREYGADTKIKWPNDIYAGDRKICGILIENTISGDKLSASIAGIGININQQEFSPAIPNPVSLSLLTGKMHDPFRILESFLEKFEGYYQDLYYGIVPEILDTEIYYRIIRVTEDEAYAAARLLARKEGILVGITSGAALHAAIYEANKAENEGKTIVALLPDTGERYLSTPLFE